MDFLLQEQLAILKNYAREQHVPIIGEAGERLLLQTVDRCRPRSVLEIGAAIGYSALLIAAQLPPAASITTMEIDAARADVARQAFAKAGMDRRIHLLEGDAGQLLDGLEDSYDLVFIDAAKGQYPDYLRKIRRLLRPGGVIIADNVLFRGMVLADAPPPRRYRTLVRRLREYLEIVSTESVFQTEIFPLGDGMAVSYYQGEKSIDEKT